MSSERLSILGKIEAATPEVVVFAVQTSAGAFLDGNGNEDGTVVEDAIDAAVKAFEDKGATAAAFAQRAIFHGEGEGRLVVEIVREPLEQETADSEIDDDNGDDSGERA